MVNATPTMAYRPSPTSCGVKRWRFLSLYQASWRMNDSDRGRRSGTWMKSVSMKYPSSSRSGMKLKKMVR